MLEVKDFLPGKKNRPLWYFFLDDMGYGDPGAIGRDGFPGAYGTELVLQLSGIADKYRQALGDGRTKKSRE